MWNWRNGHVSPVALLSDVNLLPSEDRSGVLDVRMGGFLPDHVRRDVPVVVLPLFGISRRAAESYLRAIAQYQAMFPLFKLVIFTDLDVFSIVRPYRWPIEHVMSEDSWERLGFERPWASYLVGRYRHLVSAYGASAMIGVNEGLGLPVLLEELSAAVQERGTVPDHIMTAAEAVEPGERWSWRGWLPTSVDSEFESVRVTTPKASCSFKVQGMGGASRVAIIDVPQSAQEAVGDLRADLLHRGWGVAVLEFDDASDFASRLLAYRSVSAAYPSREVSVLLSPLAEAGQVPRHRVPDVDVTFTFDALGVAKVGMNCPGYVDLAASSDFNADEVAKFAVAVRAARAIQQIGQ